MCDFCILFDFSNARARVEDGVAWIEKAPENIPFLPKQQFNFCPVCGNPLTPTAQKQNNKFGQNLRTVRMLRGVTQEALARSLGLKKCAISKYENGRTYPNAKRLAQICRLLEVSPQELI